MQEINLLDQESCEAAGLLPGDYVRMDIPPDMLANLMTVAQCGVTSPSMAPAPETVRCAIKCLTRAASSMDARCTLLAAAPVMDFWLLGLAVIEGCAYTGLAPVFRDAASDFLGLLKVTVCRPNSILEELFERRCASAGIATAVEER